MMTVVDHLRTVEKRGGVKARFAEGNRGARTVVFSAPAGDGIKCRAVKARITAAPALDGKQIVTVKHRCDAGGSLTIDDALAAKTTVLPTQKTQRGNAEAALARAPLRRTLAGSMSVGRRKYILRTQSS